MTAITVNCQGVDISVGAIVRVSSRLMDHRLYGIPPKHAHAYCVTHIAKTMRDTPRRLKLITEDYYLYLRAIHLDASGKVVNIPGTHACEKFISGANKAYTYPSQITEVLQASGDLIPGTSYSMSEYEATTSRYAKVDQSVEGWSNLPTAVFWQGLISDGNLRQGLRDLVTKPGAITEAGLRQFSTRRKLEDAYVQAEQRETEGFPAFMPYLQFVSFAELAAELTTHHKDGLL